VTAVPQTRTGHRFVHCGLVELDLLAAHAGVPFPFPLRIPEFGRITAERQVLLAAAGLTLRSRGLASEHGPVGIAAEVVTALREYRGTVDLVLTGPDTAVGVLVLVYRSWALICRQQLTGDPSTTVRIMRVAQNALADELIRMVPELAPAPAMPITLPPDDGADPADPEVLDQLADLLPELTGRGQLGVTRRGAGGNARAGTELSWLDGPRGRVRVDRTADGWVSVNPLRQNETRFAIDELAMIARREHRGS
jgi:hypothetical protein